MEVNGSEDIECESEFCFFLLTIVKNSAERNISDEKVASQEKAYPLRMICLNSFQE